MKREEELWRYTFHLVCGKYLVATEMDFVALKVDVRLDTGEVEDAGEIEWVVYI